jgi:hypothetical protein
MNNDDTAAILNDLIKISKDGEEGFRTSAELVNDESLKKTFLEMAEVCKKAVTVLQNKVKELGVRSPEQSGSVLGSLHRGWLNIKTMVATDNDSTVLEECERAEGVAKIVYTKALEQDLPDEVRGIVQHQYEGLLKNYELVRNLRDTYDVTT